MRNDLLVFVQPPFYYRRLMPEIAQLKHSVFFSMSWYTYPSIKTMPMTCIQYYLKILNTIICYKGILKNYSDSHKVNCTCFIIQVLAYSIIEKNGHLRQKTINIVMDVFIVLSFIVFKEGFTKSKLYLAHTF